MKSKVLRFERRPFVREKQPTLETLDFAFHFGSSPTFLYFDLYLNTCLRSTLRLLYNRLLIKHINLLYLLLTPRVDNRRHIVANSFVYSIVLHMAR